MGYKKLGRYLQDYQVNPSEQYAQFFKDYDKNPFLDQVVADLRRENEEDRGRGLAQISGQFAAGGRYGSGLQGDQLLKYFEENQEGLQQTIGGLLAGDYGKWQDLYANALGLLSNENIAARGNIAQGYGADQARIGQIRSADMYSSRSLQGQLAAIAEQGQRRGMDERFGTWDRQYRTDMMPWDILGNASSIYGNLIGPYGQQNQWGTQQTQGPSPNPWGAFFQGAGGGGAQGWDIYTGWRDSR